MIKKIVVVNAGPQKSYVTVPTTPETKWFLSLIQKSFANYFYIFANLDNMLIK